MVVRPLSYGLSNQVDLSVFQVDLFEPSSLFYGASSDPVCQKQMDGAPIPYPSGRSDKNGQADPFPFKCPIEESDLPQSSHGPVIHLLSGIQQKDPPR